MPLDDLEFANERIEQVLESEPPCWAKEGCSYAGTVKKFFGKIRALRNRGFSYIQICRAFEKAGLLSADSNPDSFRQAFARESARRDRTNELLMEVRAGPSAEEPLKEANPPKKVSDVTANPKPPRAPNIAPPSVKQDAPQAAAAPESEEAMREKLKRMTSRVIDTGTGKIIKNHDGTFEY